MDDVLLTGNDFQHVQSLIHKLSSAFKLHDLGRLHYFLGIQAKPTEDGILLS